MKPTETVFLFGLGGLGFNALQIIRSIGARVIVSDIRDERLDAAEELGIPRKDIVPVGKLLPSKSEGRVTRDAVEPVNLRSVPERVTTSWEDS